MTDTHRTPDDYEREIAAERSRLAGSINQLQDKFSMENIVRDVGEGLREQSGEMARAMGRVVSRNPTAALVAGVGIAWLLFGKGTGGSMGAAATEERSESRASRDVYAAPKQTKDDAARFARLRQEWSEGSDSVSEGIASGTDKVREGYEAAREWVGETASSLRDRLTKGTEGFSEEARARIVAARQAAWDAQESARKTAQKGAAGAADLYENQPLVVGAMAVAVGAAIAGIMPRTRFEDETMGASSDALYHEAQRIFSEEKGRLHQVAASAAAEAGKVVREAGDVVQDRAEQLKDAVRSSADKVDDALHRVADAARQDLGSRPAGET